MKKNILSILFMMLFSIAANAAENKAIRAIDSNEYTHYYYYNEQNQLIWELFGTTRREFSYNEAGQLTSMNQKAWVTATGNYTLNQQETYEYDAKGNLSKKIVVKNPGSTFEVTWTYKYFDYVDGVATYYDEYKNGNLYYMYKQLPEFDAQKRLVKCVVMYADPDDYTNPTYGNVNYDSKDFEYTKTWGEDGTLASEKDGKVTYEYTYAELDAAYTPTGLKAESDNGEVTLTWNAVAGAAKYIVSFDQERIEVEGTTYKASVDTGERQFTVQAIIGDNVRNAATPVTATVVDPGKLPITNLAVGQMTKTTEETESAEAPTRDFFNIPLTWTLPEGHSEVEKYYVYYDSKRYGKGTQVTVSDKNATSFTLKIDIDEVAEWDNDGKPVKGIDTPIYMTVVYVTGESDKSNVVQVNPFKDLGLETSVDNLSGTAVKAVRKYLKNGEVIIKKGNKKYGVDAIEVK